jgi:hypothetical protein
MKTLAANDSISASRSRKCENYSNGVMANIVMALTERKAFSWRSENQQCDMRKRKLKKCGGWRLEAAAAAKAGVAGVQAKAAMKRKKMAKMAAKYQCEMKMSGVINNNNGEENQTTSVSSNQ